MFNFLKGSRRPWWTGLRGAHAIETLPPAQKWQGKGQNVNRLQESVSGVERSGTTRPKLRQHESRTDGPKKGCGRPYLRGLTPVEASNLSVKTARACWTTCRISITTTTLRTRYGIWGKLETVTNLGPQPGRLDSGSHFHCLTDPGRSRKSVAEQSSLELGLGHLHKDMLRDAGTLFREFIAASQ